MAACGDDPPDVDATAQPQVASILDGQATPETATPVAGQATTQPTATPTSIPTSTPTPLNTLTPTPTPGPYIYANAHGISDFDRNSYLHLLLRLGRRYPQTRQRRSQLRPIRQPRLTPQHRRPHRRQPLLPPSRPRRPRLRLIRRPLFPPRHQRPHQHPPIPQPRHQPLYPLQHRAQPTLQRPLPYPNLVPTGPQCSIRLPTPV